MQVGEINGIEDLEALRLEWSRLWERCPHATIFQTPEWLLPWCRNLFGGGSLWSLAVWRDGRLAALAPMFIWGGERKCISMTGAGVTDYLDFLCEPDVAAPAVQMILGRLGQREDNWRVCVLDDLPPESPLLARGAIPESLAWRRESCANCPVLDLPATVEELYRRLPHKFQVDLRRAKNRLARAGKLEVELAGEPTLPWCLASLFELHQARWQARSQTGMLASGALQAFHREAAAGFLRRGALRLWVLRLNGAAAAVLYAFARWPRLYIYLGGFEPSLSRLSPGTVLMSLAIEQAICERFQQLDFLRNPESFKRLWGARDRWSQRLVIRRSGAAAGGVGAGVADAA
ncbi:MAG TPA: GNAT family N-acetyltransferase [Bryobacterales bacterium]|jgi:CelD/BcsL family acetyltransferase involved in cellulose biosynthesis|nr:GNAT family N-acetyltransferase [Bryobacterales bacterium]